MSIERGGTLELLAELRQMLSEQATPGDRGKWWDTVLLIESSLETDPRFSQQEKSLMTRLRSGVSDVIAAHNKNLNAQFSLATMPLTALETSVKRRTTGADGWPIA